MLTNQLTDLGTHVASEDLVSVRSLCGPSSKGKFEVEGYDNRKKVNKGMTMIMDFDANNYFGRDKPKKRV